MRKKWSSIVEFIEALSNFVFAMMTILFIPAMLILIPLYKLSKTNPGWSWDMLFLAAILIFFATVSVLVDLIKPEGLT